MRGVRLLEEDDRAAAALPLVSDGALSTTPVADYARYYTGLALMRLERYAEADSVLGDLAARQIDGHLPEDAAFRLAEIRETQKDYKGAVGVYESLVLKKLAQPQRGVAASWPRRGSRRPADAIGRSLAARVLRLPDDGGVGSGRAGARQAGCRSRSAVCRQGAGARRDAVPGAAMGGREDSRTIACRSFVTGADRDRVTIRIAAAEIALGRNREGRDALRPHLSGPLADEANFHYVTATRGLKLKDEHIALSRAFVEKFPNSPFAEEVLNNLASAYIIDDQDAEADAVFREILNRYPAGPLRRARGVEGRMVGVSAGPVHRRAAVFRSRRRAVPAIRLSAVVAVLVGPRRAAGGRSSKPASRGCGWPRPIITTRITAGWR